MRQHRLVVEVKVGLVHERQGTARRRLPRDPQQVRLPDHRPGRVVRIRDRHDLRAIADLVEQRGDGDPEAPIVVLRHDPGTADLPVDLEHGERGVQDEQLVAGLQEGLEQVPDRQLRA